MARHWMPLVVALLFVAAPPAVAAQRAAPTAVTGGRAFGIEALGATVGSALGTAVASRWAGTEPSLIGAFVGAAAGAAVGIGLEHFITEEMDHSLGDTGTVVLFSVTQGILAASGSRLVARLRRD